VKGLRFVVVPAAALLVLGLGGCFSWRYHTWDDIRVKSGESTTARVYVAPSDAGPDVDVPFFLVGLEGGLSLGPAKWDLTGKFNGPAKMAKDPDLRDALLLDDNCADAGLEPASFDDVDTWTAVRLDEAVDDGDAVNRLVQSTLKVKADPAAETDVVRVHLIVGGWEDDGDGLPEDPSTTDDDYECGGGTLTNLAVKGTG
jgi:hypothetical protein